MAKVIGMQAYRARRKRAMLNQLFGPPTDEEIARMMPFVDLLLARCAAL